MAKKKNDRYESLVDWVLRFGSEMSPSDAQFSAYECADLIRKYNRDRLSGKVNF